MDAIIERSLTYLDASTSASTPPPAAGASKQEQRQQQQGQEGQNKLSVTIDDPKTSSRRPKKRKSDISGTPAHDLGAPESVEAAAVDTGDIRMFKWVKQHKPCLLVTPAGMAIVASSNAAADQGNQQQHSKRQSLSWPKPCGLDGAPVSEHQLAAVAVDGQQLAEKLAALKQQQKRQGSIRGKAKKVKQQGMVEFGRPFVDHTERIEVLLGQPAT